MRLVFQEKGWDDYLFWLKTDRATLKKINSLIKEILRTPFEGNGKPEPLKPKLKGYWSRRINLEHRIVYKILENDVIIAQCRYHY